jgi:hypothetical protein
MVMNLRETRRYEMLVRVRDFGSAHAGIFPPDSLGGQTFAAVTAAVAAFGQHAGAQMSCRGSAREGLDARTAARARLWTALDAVRRTARALALDTPGLAEKFRLPSGQGAQALIAAARAFVQDAGPLATQLVAHGLPATFLNDLVTAISSYEGAIGARATAIGARAAARAGLATALGAGLAAVERLDAIVQNRLHDDPETSAAWERARHVDEPPRVRNGARKPQPPAPPASDKPAAA